jgi:hypothetical protein
LLMVLALEGATYLRVRDYGLVKRRGGAEKCERRASEK